MTSSPSDDEMPDFANVQSGASSSADDSAPAYTSYTIKPGDSLSKIAKHAYGNASAWNRIFEANLDTIKDPNKIYPGQIIKIPL
jgi:nucleoid-associated protein YgaU